MFRQDKWYSPHPSQECLTSCIVPCTVQASPTRHRSAPPHSPTFSPSTKCTVRASEAINRESTFLHGVMTSPRRRRKHEKHTRPPWYTAHVCHASAFLTQRSPQPWHLLKCAHSPTKCLNEGGMISQGSSSHGSSNLVAGVNATLSAHASCPCHRHGTRHLSGIIADDWPCDAQGQQEAVPISPNTRSVKPRTRVYH